MKAILLVFLLVAALCDEYHFYHYNNGELIYNNKPKAKVDGPIFVEFLKTMNLTILAGMQIDKSTHTPFGIVANITNITIKGENVEIYAKCWEMAWGLKNLGGVVGTVHATGSWKKHLKWKGDCYSTAEKVTMNVTANGVYSKCPFYLPHEAAKRAHVLLKEKAEAYKAVNVLNFAIMGYPYLNNIKNCSFYQKSFPQTNFTKPGAVIVGDDGVHCAIIDSEGDKFIHSNPTKKVVEASPLTEAMLKTFFPKKWSFRDYHC
jgi:hypothetical protein